MSALDSGGMTGSIAVTVTVEPVDEPPEITLAAGGPTSPWTGDAVSVDENHTADLVYVTATDPEGIHTDYTLALGGTDSSSFTLNAGVLSFTNPPNHEAREVYRLRLTASNASESSTLDVTVTVGDVNERPIITGEAEVTVNEGHTGTLRTYQKSDPDRPLQTTNWGPVGSSEVLSGTDSDAFVFDQLDGSLTFASPPDFEGGGSQYQVILTANDGKLDGTSRHHRERRQPGGDGHARAEWGRTAGRQRRVATGDADGSGRRRHRDVGMAALGRAGRAPGRTSRAPTPRAIRRPPPMSATTCARASRTRTGPVRRRRP